MISDSTPADIAGGLTATLPAGLKYTLDMSFHVYTLLFLRMIGTIALRFVLPES